MPRQGLWLKWIKMEPRSQIFPTIICGVEARSTTLHSRRLRGVFINTPQQVISSPVHMNLGAVIAGLCLYDMGAKIVAPNEFYTGLSLGLLSGVPGSCKCTHGWTRFSISVPITVTLRNLFATSKVSSVPIGKGDYQDRQRVLAIA